MEHQTEREVIVAKAAGTCFGVERALRMVTEASAAHPGEVRTLGPLIHNARVVAELADAGVRSVETPAEAEGRYLVLRSHGVTPDEEAEARKLCAGVIDATCPFVKRVHRAAEELSAQGRSVVVAGDATHPEVRATCAHAALASAAASADEVAALRLEGAEVGVVAQTTLERRTLDEVVAALRARGIEPELRDTICSATAERQQAACELAGSVDVMVVIGGRHSANTRHLAELCARSCAATHLVESADELDPAWLAGASRIGVTAGASTPVSQIDEVVQRISSL